MKKQLLLSTIIILLIFISLCGCSEQEVNRNPADNIRMFECITEGEVIRFYFVLEDEYNQNTACDGNVKIIISDGLDNIVYSNNFNVKSSDFLDYEYKLTGTPIGKAYEWRVPNSDIKKGFSLYGFGTAYLNFTNTKGKIITAKNELVEIPTYTEEEVNTFYEEEYIDDSITINKKQSKGNFEITVLRAGFFKKYKWGDVKEYFRIDMNVKNIGDENQYFDPSNVAIIDEDNNQYESSYEGTLSIVMIYPDVEKSGYFLFDDVPETVENLKLVFEAGYDDYFNPYLFQFDINL